MQTERELIQRAQQGDRDAYGELVGLHQARLRAFAARYVPGSEEVYDLVQDSFLDGLRTLDTFDPDRDFGKWMRGICRHRILTYFRSRKTRRAAQQSLVEDALQERVAADAEPADDGDDRLAALAHCLEGLAPRHREVLQSRYHAGRQVQEIASDLSQTAAGVAMLLVRLRQKLLKCVSRRLEATGHAV